MYPQYGFGQQYGTYNNFSQQQMAMPSMPQSQQISQITRVNGENGARAYQLAPNSSVLLLDETAPVVWLAQTDGAGYKTVTPYEIKPLQQSTPKSDVSSLEKRIEKLEAIINEQSDITGNVRKRKSDEHSEPAKE